MNQGTINDKILESVEGLRGDVKEQSERLHGVEKILVVQEANLREHMRRSEALERRVEQVDIVLKPVQEQQAFRKKLFEYMGMVATIASMTFSVLKIFKII